MTFKIGLKKKIVLFLLDTFIFFFSLCLALYIRRPDIWSFNYFLSHIPTFLYLYVFFLISFFISGFYEINQLNFRIKILKYISYIVFSYIIFGIVSFYLFPSNYSPKVVLLIQATILYFSIGLWRIYASKFLKNKNSVKAIMFDKTEEGMELRLEIEKNDYGIELQDNLKFDFNNFISLENNSSLEEIKSRDTNYKYIIDSIKENKIEMIIADIKNENLKDLFPYIYSLSGDGVKLYDLKLLYQSIFRKMPLSGIGYFWFYENVSLNTKFYEFFKRLLDILLSIPVFFVWLFVHPWVSYRIKKEDSGDIYSIQERLGRYNKKIFIKKYRTMNFTDRGVWLENSQNKVTEIGKFLRKTRIDELPQIFSVIKGDLSFIGPRTDIVNLGEKLAMEVDYYNLRYSVKPGLSGWAQVNMNYQPRTIQDSIERLKYDLYYVQNRSMFLDIIIILKTIKTIISREGS